MKEAKYSIEEIHKTALRIGLDEMRARTFVNSLPNKRTIQENKSLHVYCTELARKLNDQGQTYNIGLFLGIDFEVPFTMELVKNEFWRKIQIILFGKESTTKLSHDEINPIVDVINKFMAEKFGISQDWPHIENTADRL